MNLRDRIADWISAGSISVLMCESAAWKSAWEAVRARVNDAEKEADGAKDMLRILEYDNKNGWLNSNQFSAVLQSIASMETPGANATVRRMAKAAKEALK